MIFKIQHFWEEGWGDVVIPFICEKCGKCCRELSIGWNIPDIKRAADHLGLEQSDFIEKYMGGNEEGGSLKFEKTVSPCPFVKKEGKCKIYSARPIACRLYPIKTRHLSGGVECPGLKEMKREIEELAGDLSYVTTNHSIYPNSKLSPDYLSSQMWKKPEKDKWSELRKRFLKIGESEEAKNLFLKLNEMVRNETL